MLEVFKYSANVLATISLKGGLELKLLADRYYDWPFWLSYCNVDLGCK
jgi:hypothetical protein